MTPDAFKCCRTCGHWQPHTLEVGYCGLTLSGQFGGRSMMWAYSETEPSVADSYRLKLSVLTGSEFGRTNWKPHPEGETP